MHGNFGQVVSSAEAMFSCLFILVFGAVALCGTGSGQLPVVLLKAAFSEICLNGRDETVGATTCCQVRVSDARRAIIFQCKSDMPHGGRGFHPNCFFCGACARAKGVATHGVFDTLHQVVFECA